MEIPPASSYAQASALFTGNSIEETKEEALRIYPYSVPNVWIESSNRQVATSVTSDESAFRAPDFVEGHRLIQGHLLYPFASNADFEHSRFDVSYFDGSVREDFNIQENLIGTPLGASTLMDPRMAYLDNILKLKEHHAGQNVMNDDYLKQLFMTNTEKGANYYLNQLHDMQPSLDNFSRKGRDLKNTPIEDIHFTSHNTQGITDHKNIHTKTRFATGGATPSVQYNYRRDRMRRRDSLDPYSRYIKREGVETVPEPFIVHKPRKEAMKAVISLPRNNPYTKSSKNKDYPTTPYDRTYPKRSEVYARWDAHNEIVKKNWYTETLWTTGSALAAGFGSVVLNRMNQIDQGPRLPFKSA